MANDLNQCNFIGRLGKDVDLRYTSGGDPIANFSMAVGWKSKDKEGAEWVPVVCFGKLAENVGQYLGKGSQVFVTGRFKTDKYEKDGQTHYSTKIVAERVQFLDSKGSEQPKQQDYPAPRNAPEQEQFSTAGIDEPCPECNGTNPDCPVCGIPF